MFVSIRSLTRCAPYNIQFPELLMRRPATGHTPSEDNVLDGNISVQTDRGKQSGCTLTGPTDRL
jgi:hypothetical protein